MSNLPEPNLLETRIARMYRLKTFFKILKYFLDDSWCFLHLTVNFVSTMAARVNKSALPCMQIKLYIFSDSQLF